MTRGEMIGVGPRLDLRVLQAGDVARLFDLNESPEVMRYTGDPPFADLSEVEALVAQQRSRQQRDGVSRFGVVERASGELVGWCGLKRHDDGLVDLGYRFFRRVWGAGYATESARVAIAWGFEVAALDVLYARAMKENAPSWRVLEKLGFNREGASTCGGEPAFTYVMNRSDYEPCSDVRLAQG